jgi:hypothetical protein
LYVQSNKCIILSSSVSLERCLVSQGDSGGPLVHEENGVPTLVGVTAIVAATSSGGCHSGHPAGNSDHLQHSTSIMSLDTPHLQGLQGVWYIPYQAKT